MINTTVGLARNQLSSTTEFDDLVTEAVDLLESGKSVDLDAILVNSPQHREQLEKLLPTLEAIVDLGHATAKDEHQRAHSVAPFAAEAKATGLAAPSKSPSEKSLPTPI